MGGKNCPEKMGRGCLELGIPAEFFEGRSLISWSKILIKRIVMPNQESLFLAKLGITGGPNQELAPYRGNFFRERFLVKKKKKIRCPLRIVLGRVVRTKKAEEKLQKNIGSHTLGLMQIDGISRTWPSTQSYFFLYRMFSRNRIIWISFNQDVFIKKKKKKKKNIPKQNG